MASSSQPTFDQVSSLTKDQIVLPDGLMDRLLLASTNSSYKSSGAGSYLSTYQTITTQFDRLGYNPMAPNHERAGLTFFTRPRLNLMGSNLRQDRVMATLDTLDNSSFPFSIRCYLDSEFARWSAIKDLVGNSPLINSDTPFIVPLTNQLQSITGWPPFVVGHESLQPGFYNENQTIARGSDFGNRTVDLTLTFRDFQGGYIYAFFLYYLRYMALVCRGDMLAYQDDVYDRRLNYTMSIYRFVLDPSKRYITKWAKATGSFPYELPIGSVFDINRRETFVHASEEVTIPFVANHIEYMDPIIFQDFNTIVQEWGGDIFGTRMQSNITDGSSNFRGLPIIDTVSGSNELLWMAKAEEFSDPSTTVLQQIKDQVNSQLSSMNEPADTILTGVPSSDYTPPSMQGVVTTDTVTSAATTPYRYA